MTTFLLEFAETRLSCLFFPKESIIIDEIILDVEFFWFDDIR